MNPEQNLTDQLGDELRRRAGGDVTAPTHSTPISLDRVRGRARSIQRRRRGAGALAAAAAIAVIVPTALWGGDLIDRSEPQPAVREHVRVALNPNLTQGRDVKLPYLEGSTLHVPGSETIELDQDYGGLTPFGDGWITSTSGDGGETFPVTILDSDGKVAEEFVTTSGAFVSEDGTVAAWVTMDNEITIRDENGTRVVHEIQGDRLIQVRAVQGSSPCGDSESDGCSIYIGEQIIGSNRELPEQVVRTGSGREPAPGDFTAISSVSEDLIAGDLHRQGTAPNKRACDAVWSVEESRQLWRTCRSNLEFSRFSPDGKHVTSTIDDKYGTPRALRVHDARSGRAVLTATLPRGNMYPVTWEDDTRLLVHVARPMADDDSVTHDLYRVSLDGKASLVRSTSHDDPMSSPWAIVD